jgi:lipoprotein NlpD
MVARALRPLAAGLAIALVVAGCATRGTPVVAERSPVFGARPADHVVRSGDTLWSIAWRYRLDVYALARANGLAAPYTIRPGQRIRLSAAPARPAVQPPAAAGTAPSRGADPAAAAIAWRWPVVGRVLREFGTNSPGIDFELADGATVRAAASGEVVYAGSGLGGYRRLAIVRHDARFLSAYSLNGDLDVAEGDRLVAGGRIGSPERARSGAAALHFEIRSHGDPVDPRRVLPAR